MKILHTSDWHVGKPIRGRSRAVEHEAVLEEIAALAKKNEVDLVIVAGDLFDTAAPTAESERIVYRALLDLVATGATVAVISGNHDNERRLQAVRPLLEQGEIITRAELLRPDDGGVIERQTSGGEPYRLVMVPFLSQRYIVKADDLMALDPDDHSGQYAQRVRMIFEHLCESFDDSAVNLIATHLTITGAAMGGGERESQTIFDYSVNATAFPASAHYVALGHLHRAQKIPAASPAWYSGSPLQLDFGETQNEPGVLLVEAHPGIPAEVNFVALQSGRRLSTLSGTLEQLEAKTGTTGDDYLRIVIQEAPRPGLADEVRRLFPDAVDVRVEAIELDETKKQGPSRTGKSPHDLFVEYLDECGASNDDLVKLFDRLLDEANASVTA